MQLRRRGLFIAGLLFGLCSAGAYAQSSPQAAEAGAESPGVGLSEVVVTATRRESNMQSTPIAVTGLDQALIQQVAPNTISDLAAYVPNFSASKIQDFNAASFALRGVGNTDIIIYNEPPVAVLVDDFVMPSVQTQLLDAFDVQSIDVLRGPQGTLFGKNTTGGAVVVHTKAPVLNQTSFEGRALAGSYNERNFQGALNIPLITDALAFRLVASEERQEGWMRNGGTNTIFALSQPQYDGTYTGDGMRVGGTDVFTGRAKLLFQPNDTIRALGQYEIVRDRSQSPAVVNVTPNDPRFVFADFGLSGAPNSRSYDGAGVTNRNGYLIDMSKGHRVDVNGGYLNVDFTLDPGTISWVNGYRSQESSLPSDYTGIVGPLSLFDANRSDIRRTWQEELRFASKIEGPFNYVVGGFYQHDHTEFCVAQLLGLFDLFPTSVPPVGAAPGGYNNNPQVLCNAQTERSAAAYGEGNYKVNDKLTLTLGARYTNDHKDWIGRRQEFVQNLDAPVGFDPNAGGGTIYDPAFTWQQLGRLMNAADFARFPNGVVTDSHTWSDPTYRFIAGYQFTADIYGYGSYSHGFKAGGYNDQVGTSGNAITPDEKRPTNPEKADSYELGLKSEWLDHRIRLNEALFYVKYHDAIRQVVVPTTNANGKPGEETLFRNAAGVTNYGIENELTAQVVRGLILRLPFSYQHCKYDKFTSSGEAYDLTTLPVSRCPQYTATFALNYTMPVPQVGGQVTFDASANYTSKNLYTFSIASNAPDTRTYEDARTLIDASVTYASPDDRWFVRLLGKNLANKFYKFAGQNVDPLWIDVQYGEPRTWAAQVGYKFSDK